MGVSLTLRTLFICVEIPYDAAKEHYLEQYIFQSKRVKYIHNDK